MSILAELQRRFGDVIVETHEHRGDLTAVIARDALLAVLAHCRDDAALAFDVLMDLTAVDYLKFPGREDGPRFEVVYHLYSIARNHRLRLKVRLDEAALEQAAAVLRGRNYAVSRNGHSLCVEVGLRAKAGPLEALRSAGLHVADFEVIGETQGESSRG